MPSACRWCQDRTHNCTNEFFQAVYIVSNDGWNSTLSNQTPYNIYDPWVDSIIWQNDAQWEPIDCHWDCAGHLFQSECDLLNNTTHNLPFKQYQVVTEKFKYCGQILEDQDEPAIPAVPAPVWWSQRGGEWSESIKVWWLLQKNI